MYAFAKFVQCCDAGNVNPLRSRLLRVLLKQFRIECRMVQCLVTDRCRLKTKRTKIGGGREEICPSGTMQLQRFRLASVAHEPTQRLILGIIDRSVVGSSRRILRGASFCYMLARPSVQHSSAAFKHMYFSKGHRFEVAKTNPD
jgi:hypothetical protein